tara:strand:- start:5793 stop:6074 length:282 start_codon:yes stop_codon:yes gene_type:complete
VKKIIENIDLKINKLINLYNQTKIDNLNLQKNNEMLKVLLEKKENNLKELEEKIKLMNISKSVDSSQGDVKATRLKINEYVREIDKCIALLNK